jgi:hypothetical protein
MDYEELEDVLNQAIRAPWEVLIPVTCTLLYSLVIRDRHRDCASDHELQL